MKIKSNHLGNEQEVFYKEINTIPIYLNYSIFNLSWISELEISPKIIFDVGCNNGGDSIRFKQQWKEAEVHSFEADPEIYDKIKDYMLEEGIILSGIGVSDEDGELDFYQGEITSVRKNTICGSGTFAESRGKSVNGVDHRVRFKSPIKVKTISLYSYCKENNIVDIDLLHIDAEGWELNIIKGLKDIRPKVIFAEQHHYILTQEQINEFTTYMESHDYHLNMKKGVDYLYIEGDLWRK